MNTPLYLGSPARAPAHNENAAPAANRNGDFQNAKLGASINDNRASHESDQDQIDEFSAAPMSNWPVYLLKTKRGDIVANLHNASIPLQHAPEFFGCLGFDEFAGIVTVLSPLPWDEDIAFQTREWSEFDVLQAASWLQFHDINVKVHEVKQAAIMVAFRHKFHPVRQFLDSLVWDGQLRLKDWLITYLGAVASEYTQLIGPRFLISAVARIFQPGCQADLTLILEGEQGIRKSSALRILAEPWFVDHLPKMGTKDAALQMHGKWIIELGELEPLGNASVEQLNAFLTCRVDRYRPPYGTAATDVPRQCVLAGTTNRDDYLRDPTGARRMGPVTVHKCDVEQLELDRDQIWAEAVALYRGGSKWWLDEEEAVQLASIEQSARYVGDPWQDLVQVFLEGREAVTMPQILGDCLRIDAANWKQADQNRVSKLLRAAGWKRKRVRVDNTLQWQYQPQAL